MKGLVFAGILSIGWPALSFGAEATAPERVAWRGEPIAIALTLGQERAIRFAGAPSLRAGLIGGPVPGLRIQALDERVFVLAEKPFEKTRLLVKTGTARSVLLDLVVQAQSRGTAAPIEILLPEVAEDAAVNVAPSRATPLGYVALVRHAAQTLYAPERLIPGEERIVRAPLRLRDVRIALLRGGRVEASALAAWRAEGARGPLWVTAVKLRNTTEEAFDLDPRDLRGAWLGAAFQHGHLGVGASDEAVTTVYLVSAQPFEAALGAFAPSVVTSEVRR